MAKSTIKSINSSLVPLRRISLAYVKGSGMIADKAETTLTTTVPEMKSNATNRIFVLRYTEYCIVESSTFSGTTLPVKVMNVSGGSHTPAVYGAIIEW